jgi:hypothetical protein
MIQHLSEVSEEENYSTRSMANNIIKINCHSAETYRKMIASMKENIIYHSYQLKNEGPYKIVIKHIHHSVKLEDITDELSGLGHKVRNIINAKHRQTKEPLNLFFVDLEPAEYNKEIYKIKGLQNKIIEIEPPNKSKPIIQCTRHIVIDPTCLLNVEDNTTQRLVKRVQILLQHLVSVEEGIPQIIRAATITIT